MDLEEGFCYSAIFMGSSLLEDILTELEKKPDSVDNFLKTYLTSKPAESIFQVYNKISEVNGNGAAKPASFDAVQDATEAYDLLRCYYFLPEAEELVNLLRRPFMKALLQCHDMVANKEFAPKLPEVPYEVDEDDVSVKVVRLVKKSEPLGATIKINDRNGAVLIARIMHGGAADRCAALNVGDEIQEINDHCVTGQDPMDVINLLTSITGEVRLKLCPSHHAAGFCEASGNSYVRALFSYSPVGDKLIPCREAGLSFSRGEVLRLVNTEDPHWWQAVKEGGSGRAGLVPSRLLQEKKDQLRNQAQMNKNKDSGKGAVLTYDFVTKYLPEERNYRPIVIVGCRRVGKNELKRRLISTEPDHFKEPIRICTREPIGSEVHGRDFLFVTQEEFETFVNTNSIIDGYKAGESERIGLCLDAVLDVVQSGRVPVFTAKFESIPNLYNGSVKPFVVYVKPPPLEVLKETRKLVSASQTDLDLSAEGLKSSESVDDKGFTEEQLEAMLSEANRMEIRYGHYFDFVVVNDDLPVALEQLSELAYRLETEPHWIPKTWMVEEKNSSL